MESSSLKQNGRSPRVWLKWLQTRSQWWQLGIGISGLSLVGIGAMWLVLPSNQIEEMTSSEPVQELSTPSHGYDIKPLIMEGGDPYIRALMRTISASEAYDPSPYTILYGGQHIQDLTKHPQICVTIANGPNRGNCSTAAGRYQFINTTWYSMAERYHPRPSTWLNSRSYSFEPQYQDAVLYAWLSDPSVWGMDISQSLRQGQINEVLRHLSPTWTSLGYGIETNSVSNALPIIYESMLQEELRLAKDRA